MTRGSRARALTPVVWIGRQGRNVALGAAGATVVVGALILTPFALVGSVVAKALRARR